MPAEASDAVKIALEAARLGGETLLRYFGNVRRSSVTAKHIGDWVSEADRASEDVIVQFLDREVPGQDILTEERGHIPSAGEFGIYSEGCAHRWIIDPLDGTTNFLRGLPIWAVSVAVEKRSEPTARWGEMAAGAIVIPMLRETFQAGASCGAWRNGSRLRMNEGQPFDSALIGTGFPFRTRHLADTYARVFSDFIRSGADLRRPGAAAVDFCFVAAGIYDGFWELDLAPWDIAAGALIVKEAGGLVGNFQGGEDYLTTGDVIAAHPAFYEEMVGVIKKHFPVGRDVDKSKLG